MNAAPPEVRQLVFEYAPNLEATLIDDRRVSMEPLIDILFKYNPALKKELFYSIFRNLGLNEFMTMEDLEAGAEPEHNDEKQILNLHNMIYTIILRCEMLIHQKNIARPEIWLQDMQEVFTNDDLNKMETLKYEDSSGYYTERNRLLINPPALLNFTIKYLTDMMKHIEMASKKMSSKCHTAIMEYFCKYIVDTELSLLRTPKEKRIAAIISAEGMTGNENIEDFRFSKSELPMLEEGAIGEFGYGDIDMDNLDDNL